MTRTHRSIAWPAAMVGLLLAVGVATAALAASPSITLSGGSLPFSTVTVSGSGFQANEPVHLSLGLNSGNTTANSSGSFSGATLTVPNVPTGNYIVIAVGQNSGFVAFNYLFVGGFFPNVSPSGWYLTPGSTLTWSGTGFAPNETVSIFDSNNTQIASFSTGGSGSFSSVGGSIVPFSAHGKTVSYTLKSSQSGVNQAFVLAVADLYPYATPSSWYTLPGTSITFSGSGFGPSEGVSLKLNGSLLSHFSADATGSFSAQGANPLPYGTGAANYQLIGDASGAIASAPVTRASFYPSLLPSAYYAAPGTTLTLGGSGFAPNEDVAVKIGTASVGTGHTDGMGKFSGISIALPATPNTTPMISGVGALSGATGSFNLAIGGYYSWMGLSTWWAMGGSAITITGHNFAGGEAVKASSGSQDLGQGTATGSGDVTITSHVPHGVAGPATIKLTGQTSGATASVDMTISPVWTDFQLGSYAGAPGGAVHFIGHGYQPNESVAITTDRSGTTPVVTITTDGTGSFDNSAWHIPSDWKEGNLTLTATGGYSQDIKSITFYVTGK